MILKKSHDVFFCNEMCCVTCNPKFLAFDFQFVNCYFDQYDANDCLFVSVCVLAITRSNNNNNNETKRKRTMFLELAEFT